MTCPHTWVWLDDPTYPACWRCSKCGEEADEIPDDEVPDDPRVDAPEYDREGNEK